ncbi:hypothetical protein CPB85DRAFT_1565331 [Mucidula mucida]|nr:hypothetical protein CPB85DRAFT_1565331 [Mucidula mucida]
MASKVLARNADHSRWDFAPDPRWQEAPTEWQEFYAVDKDELVLMQESLTLHRKQPLLRLQREYNGFRTVIDYLPPSPTGRPPPIPAHKYAHCVLCDLWKDSENKNEGEDADNKIHKPASDSKDRDKLLDYAFWLLLNDAIEKFGGVAHNVYHAVLSTPRAVLKDHQVAIASASLSKLVNQFRRDQCFSDQGIIAILPASFPPLDDDVTTFSLDFKSSWGHPESAALAGWCLPPIAFRILTSGHTRYGSYVEMATRTVQPSLFDIFIIPGSSVYYDSDDALDSLKPGTLHIPGNTKNSLFDALWVACIGTMSYIRYTIWVIQVAKSKNIAHTTSPPSCGYVLIRKVINGLKRIPTCGKSVKVDVAVEDAERLDEERRASGKSLLLADSHPSGRAIIHFDSYFTDHQSGVSPSA